MRVLIFGATGTIGRATVAAMAARGHEVSCFVRKGANESEADARLRLESQLVGADLRFGSIADPRSVLSHGFSGQRVDAVVSCMASRTGEPADAWAIDHQAHLHILDAARQAGTKQMVLLSAICVQRPRLAFQHAKLAFEQALAASGLKYSIVRPTAFFKSLSGQIERIRAGKPFLMFGDGRLTACKPISEADLGGYLADCLVDASRENRVLPVGGPGPAITPLEQGEALFELLERKPRYKRVPPGALKGIAAVLAAAGTFVPSLEAKAELARIGHYYATESMLVFDETRGRYDADATPETGSDTLFDYYRAVVAGEAQVERGDHAVF